MLRNVVFVGAPYTYWRLLGAGAPAEFFGRSAWSHSITTHTAVRFVPILKKKSDLSPSPSSSTSRTGKKKRKRSVVPARADRLASSSSLIAGHRPRRRSSPLLLVAAYVSRRLHTCNRVHPRWRLRWQREQLAGELHGCSTPVRRGRPLAVEVRCLGLRQQWPRVNAVHGCSRKKRRS